MKDWTDISYLCHGSTEEQDVYNVLSSSAIMEVLQAFTPVLAGTYPIGIHLPGSDLDIICSYDDKEAFIQTLEKGYGVLDDYTLKIKQIRGVESIIARFIYQSFHFEVFGQPIPVEKQYAYRHMIKEHELLQKNGHEFREKIIELKTKGFSTEEAFAKVLGIKGDPYEGLLNYEL